MINEEKIWYPEFERKALGLGVNKGKQVSPLKKPDRIKAHFMKLALITSQRSKDPCTQVGCVIVDANEKLVSVGYNGFPRGIDDDKFRWDKEDPNDNKHLYVVHAETNAIMNKRQNTLHGCTLYVTLLPCNECAKLIIQSRVAKIVYMEERNSTCYEASRKMLIAANIPFEKCELPGGILEFEV